MPGAFDAFTKGRRVVQFDRARDLRLTREAIDRERAMTADDLAIGNAASDRTRALTADDLAIGNAATDRARDLTADDLAIAQAAEDRPRDVTSQELGLDAQRSNLKGAGLRQDALAREEETKQIDIVRGTSLRGLNSLEQAFSQGGVEGLNSQFDTLSPVFEQLGMTGDEVADLRQVVMDDPSKIADIKAQFLGGGAGGKGGAGGPALLQTKAMNIGGKSKLVKIFKDGTTEVTDFEPTSSTQSDRKINISLGNLLNRQAGAQGNIAAFKRAGTLSADNLEEGLSEARKSEVSVRALTRQKELLAEGIRTGSLGEARHEARRFMRDVMGIPDSKLGTTDEFFALSGIEVGNIIKLFGAGTGLSDADREFAKQIVGGSQKIDVGAIAKLVDMRLREHKTIISNYQADRAAFTGQSEQLNRRFANVGGSQSKKAPTVTLSQAQEDNLSKYLD